MQKYIKGSKKFLTGKILKIIILEIRSSKTGSKMETYSPYEEAELPAASGNAKTATAVITAKIIGILGG